MRPRKAGRVVTFARYKNHKFSEIPTAYLEWAEREVTANDNASDDLKMLANYGAQKMQGKMAKYADPEQDALIPYAASEETHWSLALAGLQCPTTRKEVEVLVDAISIVALATVHAVVVEVLVDAISIVALVPVIPLLATVDAVVVVAPVLALPLATIDAVVAKVPVGAISIPALVLVVLLLATVDTVVVKVIVDVISIVALVLVLLSLATVNVVVVVLLLFVVLAIVEGLIAAQVFIS